MKRPILLFFAIFLSPSSLLSSENADSVYFFSTNRVYRPLDAGILESRIGFQKYTNTENLKLDIGASVDIVGFKTRTAVYSAGADFFTFSNLRSEDNFKFPVDAIDYFFGLNISTKGRFSQKISYSSRLRVAHISSHFEDGHIYERTDTIFTPVVFSKEFLDLSFIYEYDVAEMFPVRALAGLNCVFHSIPKMPAVSVQVGLEGRYFVTEIFSVYVSNELNIATVNSQTNPNENLETGISLGKKNSAGISVFFNYYDGQDFRGQYYGKYLNTKGFGLKINY